MDRKYIEILENFIHKPVKMKETNKISNEEVQAICKILEEYKKKELDIDGKHFLVERSVISDQWGDARGLVLVFLGFL